MKPRFIFSAILAIGLGLPVASAQASMCPEKPIRFAHYEFGLAYSSGYGGIDDDIQKELERRSGCKFEISVRPRARTWLDLEYGGLDMAGSGVQTAGRDKFAWFFHYLLEDNVVVLGPKVPQDVHSTEQFLAVPALTLGGVRSYRYSPHYDTFVDQLIASKRHTDISDPGGLYKMFDAQRFDAFITNPILYLYYVKQLKLPAPKRIESWDRAGPTPSGLVLSKRNFTEAQARQWGALIHSMLSDGTVQKIVVKHMGPELGAKSIYRASGR
ncbi:MAG: ABC transporter substrate-binding protein [Rhodoferax sp.]|nr:ABC transporter substrate-binding protein [Rhodoferax sp.]